MAAESTRQKKVSRMLQRELSQTLERDMRQLYEVVGEAMITLTHVKVTPDLQIARAYITVLPDEKLPLALKYLDEQQSEVRHKLAQRIRHSMKQTPSLEFYEDDTMKIANRIDELLANALPKDEEDEANDGDSENVEDE